MSRGVRVSVEWARFGKGDGDSFRVLECSGDGFFSAREFAVVFDRFHAGAPPLLPQVTIAWAAKGEDARIILIIHEESDRPDSVGRAGADARMFAVRYADLARGPVSYGDLYDALLGLAAPHDGGLIEVELPVLDPGPIAERLTEEAMSTAALLLAGRPVCVLGGDGLRLRLRYLDDVAALLPYGMRARLSAATWTSSTARHNIRLSFTEDRREDSHNVIWGRLARIPYEEENARVYLGLLANHADRRALVAKLAQATEPMPFSRDTRPLMVLDASHDDRREEVIPVKGVDHAESVVAELAEALERDDITAAHGCIQRLLYLSQGRTSRDQQAGIRRLIEDEELFFPHQRLGEERSRSLYGSLLRLAFGRTLSRDSLEAVIRMAGHPLPPGLLAALLKMPSYDVVVRLSIAWRISPDELARALDGYQGAELVYAVAEQGVSARLVEIVCNELARRQASGEQGDGQLTAALERNGFLAHILAQHYPASHQQQFELLIPLLKSAYGDTPLSVEDLERALSGRGAMPTVALVGAVVYLYRGDARNVLIDHFLRRMLENAGLADSVRGAILKSLPPEHERRESVPFPVPAAQQAMWQGKAQEQARRRRDTGVKALLYLLGLVALLLLLDRLNFPR